MIRRRPKTITIEALIGEKRRIGWRKWQLQVAVLCSAAVLGTTIGAGSVALPDIASTAVGYSQPLGGCAAVDGDTLRCAGERIRLLAIDAPELPGHCRPGRDCAPGDPFASTASLRDAASGELTIERVGEDRYGRTLARVSGAQGDLSCWQLRQGHAIYKSKWDNGLRIARTCPADLR